MQLMVAIISSVAITALDLSTFLECITLLYWYLIGPLADLGWNRSSFHCHGFHNAIL